LCNYYKQNFDEIFKYKSDLSVDLRDFIKVVENFEDQIKQCDKDRVTMIKTNNDIIKYKNQETQRLNERINVLNYDLEKQKIKLDKINSILDEYHSQNENYISNLNKTELNYMENFEILENKYKRLKAQYELYFNMEMKRRKIELDYKDNNLCRDEADKVNLNLQDKIVKNNFLKEMVEEIKRQIKEIESVNKRTEEEEQMIRFLGKAFYNKVKQRRAENSVKKENNENKSKSKIYLKTDKSINQINNQGKNKNMKKKFGLNLIISNSQNYMKNKNKSNTLTTYFNTSNNIYGNNLKETNFSSHKNTKNKINSTTTGSS